jgi:pyridoxal phosphate enzyme (YggS family)
MKRSVVDVGTVAARLEEVRERTERAALAAGRAPSDVELLIATKYVDVDDMETLAEAGVDLVGESRAQDLVAKYDRCGELFIWDFIGHLQSRKTKLVVPRVRRIHSISTLSAVQELQRRAENMVDVLLEVNIGEEASKSGVAPAAVDAFLEESASCDMVSFTGLMCMPPLTDRPDDAAPYFARTRELAERLSAVWNGRYTFLHLSMGTSADYEVAVREGATTVRVGTGVLF